MMGRGTAAGTASGIASDLTPAPPSRGHAEGDASEAWPPREAPESKEEGTPPGFLQ